MPDLGIAASFDPIALDQACADLVLAAPVLQTSNALTDKHKCHCHEENGDKFHILHPDTSWQSGIEYGEKIGLGTKEYELIRL